MVLTTGSGPPGTSVWWAAHAERLGRRRPRVDGLTIERIVDEALALVDGEGLDALTVRGLAARFDTSSATLYRHVASRDELLVLLVDQVLGEIRLPDPALDGRTKVVELSTEFRRVLLAHPNVVDALRAAPLMGPNAVRCADAGLANLLETGYPPDLAVPAYLAMIDYVLGSVFFQSAGGEPEPPGPLPDGAPALEANWTEVAGAESEKVFAFGLEMFLTGLDRHTGR
jgi:AcrR family transcriptional regulator